MNVAARAQAPQVALDAIALLHVTTLRKPNGGVRGIATGDVFRRLVPERWREPSAGSLTRPPALFSAGTTAWRRLSNSTPGPPSSLSMGELLTTPSAAQLYLPSYAIIPSRRPCPSPAPCMRAPPLTCGGTTRDECTTSRRLKVSSRVTPSHRDYTRLASTTR